MPPKNWDKEIWGDLSQIDVTQYAMRKGTRGFNPLYIPWSVVHHILMDKYAVITLVPTIHSRYFRMALAW